MKIIIVAILLLISQSLLARGYIEPNTDRMGSDYNAFDLYAADPAMCQQACENDSRCRAWTYVHPNTIQGPNPRCWLKNAVPAPKQSSCCVSGVVMEWNTDRMGSDYDNFDLRTADPAMCQQACGNDSRCRAWTYVQPNTTQGPNPRCWLKNSVPTPQQSSCCISGVN